MKQRSLFTALAMVAILILVGFVGFQGFGGRSSLKLITGGRSVPEAAIFVPENALAMGSFLVNLDDAENVQRVLTAAHRGQSPSDLSRLRSLVLAGTDLNYKKDIRPWLGNEVTLALMTADLDRNRNNGEQPGYLFALATTDVQRSRVALAQFWERQQSAEEEVIFEQYKGVNLTYRQPGKGRFAQGLSTAIFGDRFVLFANSPKVLREAINHVQAPSLSLNQSLAYQRAIESLNGGQLGFIFLNLGSWGLDLTRVNAVPTPQPSLALSIGANSQGLIAETALLASEQPSDELVPPTLTQPVAALQYVTAASPLAIAGTDLHHLWTELEATVAATPQLQALVQQPLAIVQDLWGLNLPQDIFSWVTGEYALALLPRPDRPQPDWLFVAQRSPQAQAAIDHIDQIAVAQGYNAGQFELDNHMLLAWTKLSAVPVQASDLDFNQRIIQAKAKGVHATIGEYELFATSVEAMDNAFDAAKSGDLLSNVDFKTSLSQLPTTNEGYLFLNWEGSRQLLQRQFPLLKIVELSAKSLFDHLRSFTITSTGIEAGVKKATVFLQLR